MSGIFVGRTVSVLEYFPSVLATWAAIDYANKNGITYFDFMVRESLTRIME